MKFLTVSKNQSEPGRLQEQHARQVAALTQLRWFETDGATLKPKNSLWDDQLTTQIFIIHDYDYQSLLATRIAFSVRSYKIPVVSAMTLSNNAPASVHLAITFFIGVDSYVN